jgi:hypothetical protein
MRATVPDVGIERASVARVDIGQVAIGPMAVGQLVIRDAAVGIAAGRAEMRDVRLTLTLRFEVFWEVHIDLPWPFDDIDVGDRGALGSMSIRFPARDAAIPGLRDIRLHIGQMTGRDVRVAADPISGLQLTAVTAEALRAADASAPVTGFTLSGLGLSSFALAGVGIPAAAVRSLVVRRATGAPITLPGLTLRGLSLPAAASNDISSAGLDIPFTTTAERLGPIDFGLLRVGVDVTPSARAQVGRLELSGVRASATVGAVEVRDVTLPYEALGLTLSDIGIETIDIPTIGVAP